MPKYAPQSLPEGAARKAPEQYKGTNQRMVGPAQPAIQLAQYVRRERGMQGVRSYVAAIREFLPSSEYQALCKTMGVPADVKQTHKPAQGQPTQGQPAQGHPSQGQPTQAQSNPANQMQMMQMLSSLMNMQGGASPGGAGSAGSTGGTGGTGGIGGAGGLNPMMLAQLLNGMNGMTGT